MSIVITERMKQRARYEVSRAVKAGKLVRQPCFCGRFKTHAHHPDYTKPLYVIWLCPQHHFRMHPEIGRNLREARKRTRLLFAEIRSTYSGY